MRVWVTYDTPKTCQCWRDAICTHGLTWQEEDEYGGEPCLHFDSYHNVHASLGDAIRSLFWVKGKAAIGRLLYDRDNRQVFVMPSGTGPLVDEHEGGPPAPLWVIKRENVTSRSTPLNDPDQIRMHWSVSNDAGG